MDVLKFNRKISPGSTVYVFVRGNLRVEVINFPGTRTIMAEVVDIRSAPGFSDGLALWRESYLKPDYTVSQVKDEARRAFKRCEPRQGTGVLSSR